MSRCIAIDGALEPSIESSPLLEGRDILCFSHDWSGDPLSKTHLMRLLAKRNRVLWVNSIGNRAPQATARDFRRILNKLTAAVTPIQEVEKNLFVLSPLVVPAWGSLLIRGFNSSLLAMQVRRAMRRLKFRKPINFVFNPAAGIVAGRLGEQAIVYYCVDEYTEFAGVNTQALVAVERELLDRADLVIVSAERLMQTKTGQRSSPVLVRHGVDYELFRTALDAQTEVPNVLTKLPRPMIGYFGLISEDWVDIPLLAHVAKSFPNASLVMLGKVAMDVSALKALPNVHLLGRQPYRSLPGFCKAFDVALIPFPVTEVTLSANPLKAREYLAAGVPVVSTAIPEVEVLGSAQVARNQDEFVAKIQLALVNPGNRIQRSKTMETESWEARLNEVERHLHFAQTNQAT